MVQVSTKPERSRWASPFTHTKEIGKQQTRSNLYSLRIDEVDAHSLHSKRNHLLFDKVTVIPGLSEQNSHNLSIHDIDDDPLAVFDSSPSWKAVVSRCKSLAKCI